MINGLTLFFGIAASLGWATSIYQLRKTVRLEMHFYQLCLLLEEHLDAKEAPLNHVDEKLHCGAVKVYKAIGLVE